MLLSGLIDSLPLGLTHTVVINAFHELIIGESYPIAGLCDQGIQEWLEHFPTANRRGISDWEEIVRSAN